METQDVKIDHVGIAVERIESALAFYLEGLGMELLHREELASRAVRVAFLADPRDPDGAQVELLEPFAAEGPVARFLRVRGPGLHHIAFRAPDLPASMARFRDAGRPPLQERPGPGARGRQVCFLHPRHAHGVLVELVGAA